MLMTFRGASTEHPFSQLHIFEGRVGVYCRAKQQCYRAAIASERRALSLRSNDVIRLTEERENIYLPVLCRSSQNWIPALLPARGSFFGAQKNTFTCMIRRWATLALSMLLATRTSNATYSTLLGPICGVTKQTTSSIYKTNNLLCL